MKNLVLLAASLCVTTAGVIAAADASGAETGAGEKHTIAVIGTGDMGDSLGPRFASLGHKVIYGSREPGSARVRELVARTGRGASATLPIEAARKANIVVLAIPWPAMEKAAQSLGSLDGKIVVDISMPSEQGSDGYYAPMLSTSPVKVWSG